MNDINQFSQAIIQGAKTPGVSSYMPEVANAMQGAFGAAAISRAGKAQGVVASQMADEEEKRRQLALQKAKDQIDPSKYQRIRKNDGGFAFYDPSGKEIDIDTFAKATGNRRTDVLKDSENPLDQQFIGDFAAMNDLAQAIYQNDRETITSYMSAYPDLFKGGMPKPEDLNKTLLEKYPHIFGMGNYQKSMSNLGKPLFRYSDNYSSTTPSSSSTGTAWVAD